MKLGGTISLASWISVWDRMFLWSVCLFSVCFFSLFIEFCLMSVWQSVWHSIWHTRLKQLLVMTIQLIMTIGMTYQYDIQKFNLQYDNRYDIAAVYDLAEIGCVWQSSTNMTIGMTYTRTSVWQSLRQPSVWQSSSVWLPSPIWHRFKSRYDLPQYDIQTKQFCMTISVYDNRYDITDCHRELIFRFNLIKWFPKII